MLSSPLPAPSSGVLMDPSPFPLSLESSVCTSDCPFHVPTATPRHSPHSAGASGSLLGHHTSPSPPLPLSRSSSLWPAPSGPVLCSTLCGHRLPPPRMTQWHFTCSISKPDAITLFRCLLCLCSPWPCLPRATVCPVLSYS